MEWERLACAKKKKRYGELDYKSIASLTSTICTNEICKSTVVENSYLLLFQHNTINLLILTHTSAAVKAEKRSGVGMLK